MSVETIIQLRALRGRSLELISRVGELLPLPIYRDACKQAQVRQNLDDPDEILLLQRWSSRRRFEECHDGFDLAGALSPLLAAPPAVRVFSAVSIGAGYPGVADEAQESRNRPAGEVPKVSTPDALGG